MSDQRYFASDTEDAPERARLDALEGLFDPPSFSRLSALGVSNGWRCLDVGGGGGSVARWLAERVGPSGHVVATDLDVRFLEAMDLPNLEARRHDFLNDDIERDAYDLVHCRHFLAHLPGRVGAAIDRMTAALKPGGVLLAEEADSTIMAAADKSHPCAAAFDRVAQALVVAARSENLWEPAIGTQLPKMFADAGLVDIQNVGWSSIEFGGDNPSTRFFGPSGALIAPLLVQKGYLSQSDWDSRDAAYADASFSFRTLLMLQVWGMRAD